MLEEGKKAPVFALKNQDGKSVSLKDFNGKKVVLYFYPKDDTSGCTKEACSFRD
jgi:peroxiredoxin Q/BCP